MPKQKDSLYFGMSTSDNPITQAMRNNPFAKLQKKMAANPHFPSAGAKPKKESSTGEHTDSSLSKKPFANYIDSLQNSGKPNYPDRYTIGGGESRSKDSVSYKSPLESAGDHWVKGLPKPQKEELPKSYYIADKAKSHLVTITNPDSQVSNNRQDTISAKEAYKRKVQWFAPGADNYWRADSIDENIKTNPNVKHFSSKDILDFAKKNKKPSDYRSEGSGDWKVSKEGADGYLISEVDGYPYYSDAIGQVPFSHSVFNSQKKWQKRTDRLNLSDDDIESAAAAETIFIGKLQGSTDWLNPFDFENNYDNKMIEKATNIVRNMKQDDDSVAKFKAVFRYPVTKKNNK